MSARQYGHSNNLLPLFMLPLLILSQQSLQRSTCPQGISAILG
jgi:hypothetical protein